ncbi:MAG: hypothetical protein ABIG55_05495 [Candidatus Omnitrophota bacterium]|nr:hypothetical protein [Candidatus Omnitrophota bacterium]
MKLIKYAVIAICVCSLLQGCGRGGPEIDKLIIAHDPSFQDTLDKRNDSRKEIELSRAEFMKKEDILKKEIDVLEKRRDQLEREYTQKTEKAKHRLDPDKRQLERELKELEEERKIKIREIQDAGKDIREINSLMKKKDVLALTPEEINTWDSRASVLVKNKEKVSAEENSLKKEIEMTKLKMKVLEI